MRLIFAKCLRYFKILGLRDIFSSHHNPPAITEQWAGWRGLGGLTKFFYIPIP